KTESRANFDFAEYGFRYEKHNGQNKKDKGLRWRFSAPGFEKLGPVLVFFKRANEANSPFSEVAGVRFFCFFFLVKKRKVLKVLCILVISMQGFVGRANSLAEHTLYGYKV